MARISTSRASCLLVAASISSSLPASNDDARSLSRSHSAVEADSSDLGVQQEVWVLSLEVEGIRGGRSSRVCVGFRVWGLGFRGGRSSRVCVEHGQGICVLNMGRGYVC